MPTYSADQIIGKSLTANFTSVVYSLPDVNSKILYTVMPGGFVGVVSSYITKNGLLFWQLYPTSTGKPYGYVLHGVGKFSVKSLKEQGSKTEQEQAEQATEENKPWYDKLTDKIGKGTVKLGVGIGIFLLIKEMIKNK